MGKKSSTTTNKTVYGKTTTSNPYVTSYTDNKGTTTMFNSGTAYDSMNNFLNTNIDNLLNDYLNPNLNSTTNQAKMNSFVNTLNNETKKNVENSIVNPLSNRNMIRSSQATDLYNHLAETNSNKVAEYTNNLLSTSQADSANLINNLLLWGLNGYGILSDAQQQSLNASQGNATKTQETTDNTVMEAWLPLMQTVLSPAVSLLTKSKGGA